MVKVWYKDTEYSKSGKAVSVMRHKDYMTNNIGTAARRFFAERKDNTIAIRRFTTSKTR